MEEYKKSLEMTNQMLHAKLDGIQAEMDRITLAQNAAESNDSNNEQVLSSNEQLLNVQNRLATSNANMSDEVDKLNMNMNRSKEKLIMVSSDNDCCNQHQGLIRQIEDLQQQVGRLSVVHEMDMELDGEDAGDKSDEESGLALMEQLLKSQREVAASNVKVNVLQQKIERLEQQLRERSPENGHGPDADSDCLLIKDDDSLRDQIANLHREIKRLQDCSKSSSRQEDTEVVDLREELRISQNQLTDCKKKISHCTQQMEDLEQGVITSRRTYATATKSGLESATEGNLTVANTEDGDESVDKLNKANWSYDGSGDPAAFSSQLSAQVDRLQGMFLRACTFRVSGLIHCVVV